MNEHAVELAKIADRKAGFRQALGGWVAANRKAHQLNNYGPIVLEIGSGHGHFLTAYAQAHPQSHCLGVDLMASRLLRSDKKKVRLGLKNLSFMKAEAAELLDSWPETALIDTVYILFPDPWPKRRHHKNRLIQPDFLTLLASRIAPHGRLYFRTDDAGYFNWALSYIKSHPFWKHLEFAPWGFEMKTVFESKALAHQSLIAECLVPIT